jgi:hypothetical protein
MPGVRAVRARHRSLTNALVLALGFSSLFSDLAAQPVDQGRATVLQPELVVQLGQTGVMSATISPDGPWFSGTSRMAGS